MSIKSGQASAGRNGTSKELSNSTRGSLHCALPSSLRAIEVGAGQTAAFAHRFEIAKMP
jgi:hypothetical protein